jgi:DNA-binding response OmpR family regulator
MRRSVLIISNNHRSQVTYVAALNGYGCEIQSTQTIEAGRALLRTYGQPDSIIVDLKHGQNNLRDFVHFVRHELDYPNTQIIVIGGEAVEQVAAYNADADQFLVRPVDMATLVKMIA